jgi:type II secretory pathway pseudopilin PulG
MCALEVRAPSADERTMKRLRSEEGFGLLELLISITILNVGILALVAAFNSGALAQQRAAQVGTAAALGERQLELYRGLKYSSITLDAASKATASADSVYAADPAYNATQVTSTCTGSPIPSECNAMRTTTGPDGISYRVDTYIVTETPPNGRAVKRVTVVVRRGSALKTLTRLTSLFDESTG